MKKASFLLLLLMGIAHAGTVIVNPSNQYTSPTAAQLYAANPPPSSGTVTTFSAGTLSPLFTTSVANPTSTPSLTFILSSVSQNFVFAGPTSGSGAPAFRALVAGDIPNLPASQITSGTMATARLGSGTANSGTILYGNSTWGAPGTPAFTIGSNATGYLTYTSGVLNFANPVNTANGFLTLDSSGNLGTPPNPYSFAIYTSGDLSTIGGVVNGVSLQTNDSNFIAGPGASTSGWTFWLDTSSSDFSLGSGAFYWNSNDATLHVGAADYFVFDTGASVSDASGGTLAPSLASILNGYFSPPYAIQRIAYTVTGTGAFSIASDSTHNIIAFANGSGAATSTTVTLPTGGFDGQTLDISYKTASTAITYAGASQIGGITVSIVGSKQRFIWDSGLVEWR